MESLKNKQSNNFNAISIMPSLYLYQQVISLCSGERVEIKPRLGLLQYNPCRIVPSLKITITTKQNTVTIRIQFRLVLEELACFLKPLLFAQPFNDKILNTMTRDMTFCQHQMENLHGLSNATPVASLFDQNFTSQRPRAANVFLR
ncbi:hypothetical protein AMTR_s00049p00120200 [Amborella trichopoda]|uniref:Uncharacterized protein n=1 Tax=Amborella trichopoda TaxID=13333 RepID=W1Q001_AMBTC|nr:hypothetical protein AMTR_s00049p00120200 [Amborella trichopoda]